MTRKGRFHRPLRRMRQGCRDMQRKRLMFLKKVDGPRAVTLPDGSVLTRADLPPANTRRWVASRKAAVVRGVLYGLMLQSEALKIYGLSEEEFNGWVAAIADHGEEALKATALKKYRQP
jgi:Protein of unknown function (DUF1153)